MKENKRKGKKYVAQQRAYLIKKDRILKSFANLGP